MATSKGTMFDPKLVKELFNKVKGKSTLAVLSNQEPIPFNGTKEFAFSFDNEIDIVAENGAKSEGGVSLAPIIIVPIKFEYAHASVFSFWHADACHEPKGSISPWVRSVRKQFIKFQTM